MISSSWHHGAMLATRRARHERLSAFLTSCSDVELGALVDAGRVSGVGVGGGSVVLDVNGVPVFAKPIPLTERELSHPHCTGNLFDLPLFCQYGIGGPGFNAWRELAANVIVTDGVLTGETESFPLLYHWRVLPGRPPVAAEHADIDAVVAALDGCSAVRARLEALATACRSLVLFCEYLPHPLLDWLREDPVGKADTVERQLSQTVAFLCGRELLHMDGHFDNMRTDGERIYLTDFGLATSPRFDLSAAERDFAQRHVRHDAGTGQLAGDRGMRSSGARQRRASRPQRVRPPVRRRSHPRWSAADRGGDPHPACTCRRENEQLLLEAVQRRRPRGVSRLVEQRRRHSPGAGITQRQSTGYGPDTALARGVDFSKPDRGRTEQAHRHHLRTTSEPLQTAGAALRSPCHHHPPETAGRRLDHSADPSHAEEPFRRFG